MSARLAATEIALPSPPTADEGPEVSLVMPCLNEAETLGRCITKAFGGLRRHNIRGEIIFFVSIREIRRR